jgi:hypothetical protein
VSAALLRARAACNENTESSRIQARQQSRTAGRPYSRTIEAPTAAQAQQRHESSVTRAVRLLDAGLEDERGVALAPVTGASGQILPRHTGRLAAHDEHSDATPMSWSTTGGADTLKEPTTADAATRQQVKKRSPPDGSRGARRADEVHHRHVAGCVSTRAQSRNQCRLSQRTRSARCRSHQQARKRIHLAFTLGPNGHRPGNKQSHGAS